MNADKLDALETTENIKWINSSLLLPGIFCGVDPTSEEDIFLLSLINRPEGSLAASFVELMKKHVHEDRGQAENINKATYATCAVLLKYNNLTSVAMGCVNGTRADIPISVINTWAAGQKMRSYFALAGAVGAVETTAKHVENSASGIETACNEVVDWATFLLNTPMSEEHSSHPSIALGIVKVTISYIY